MKREPMICPYCGSTMNEHGQKLIDPRNRDEAMHLDPALAGVVHEIHACPGCGASASRIAIA